MALLRGGILAKPSLRDLSNHVAPYVNNKWFLLGVQLFDDKDVSVLTSIEVNYRGDVDTCCTRMFERWLELAPNASWDQLINGLKAPNVKLHQLTSKLSATLGLQVNLNEFTNSADSDLHPHLCCQPNSPLNPPLLTQISDVSAEPVAADKYGVEFSLLVSNITDKIGQHLNPQHLESIKHALAHVTVHPMSPKPLFSDKELIRIKQSKNLIELMEHCRNHWSWSKYSLLQLIVKKSGSPEAKLELQRFKRTMFIRQKLKDLENSCSREGKGCPEGFQSMMVIVDEDYDDITVEQLERVEKFITEATLIPRPAMLIGGIRKENSVLIKWWIPTEAVPFAVMLALQKKEQFLRQSYLLLRIAGMDVFNLCPQLEFKEIQRLNGEIEKLGNQVKYLNKKVNTLQDHMREKKPVNQGKKLMQPPPHYPMQQPQHMMQPPHHMMQQPDHMIQKPHHVTQQPPLGYNPMDEAMGPSGGSLGYHRPSGNQATSSDVVPARYEMTGGVHDRAFMPETNRTPHGQYVYPPDLPAPAPATVKDMVSAINTKTVEDQHSTTTKSSGPHQKHVRSKTPVGVGTGETTELQLVFNKRSSKEIDPADYEEYVQKNIVKQRSKGNILSQQTYTYIAGQQVTSGGTSAVFRKQEERSYINYYADSQDTY